MKWVVTKISNGYYRYICKSNPQENDEVIPIEEFCKRLRDRMLKIQSVSEKYIYDGCEISFEFNPYVD